ncbi:MAG TPA: hypothetical protein VFJ70_02845 [Burkholderiales bacterium]|nr:hypothetical protein [Burkholderiales bacterium]
MKVIVTKDMPFGQNAANAANAAAWAGEHITGPSTARISATSAALCLGILAWVIVNAYLSQLRPSGACAIALHRCCLPACLRLRW